MLQIEDSSSGLFERWLDIEKRKGTQVEALQRLNEACGTHYDKSWPQVIKSRGYSLERTPIEVRQYMMRIVLPTLLEVDEKEIEKLVISLT